MTRIVHALEFLAEAVVLYLGAFVVMSRWNTSEARERVRAYWSLHFKASDAFGRLVDELKQA